MEESSSLQNKSTFGITALSRETPGVLCITDVIENTSEEFPVKYDILENERKYSTDSVRDYVLQRRDTQAISGGRASVNFRTLLWYC